ncbi:MAG: TraB/GumN family protein [Paracoccaceae bacterium]
MHRFLAILWFALLAAPACAGTIDFTVRADPACGGRNLLDTLPPAELARIEALASAGPYPEGNRWTAEKPGSRITVVGTLHLTDPRMAAPAGRLKAEIAAADTVYVEATDAEAKAMKAAVSHDPGLLFVTEGPTLPERLSEADWQEVKRLAGEHGIPGFMAAKMRPWYLMMVLGLPACALKDAARGGRTGLDGLVMDAADEAGVTILPLEPWDTALKVLGGMAPDDQLDMVRLSAAMARDSEDILATLQAAYFAERHRLLWEWSRAVAAERMTDPAAATEGFAVLDHALVGQRNRAWLDILVPAASGKRLVVAVGAAHLGGEDGLLAGLERAGYRLTRQTF